MSIPGLDAWLDTAQGHYVGAWEAASVEHAIADVFGFNALQLGLPQWDLLHASRIPLRQKAGESGAVDVLCELTAMPFASLSTDLVILPHVLEFGSDAHQIIVGVKQGDRPYPRYTLYNCLPGLINSQTQRVDCSHACYNDRFVRRRLLGHPGLLKRVTGAGDGQTRFAQTR